MLQVMQYGHRIRAHRERLGLTQPAFARHLGVPDAGTISRWELDKAIPSPERLEQLRQDGADLPPRIEPRTLTQRVAALEEVVDRLLASDVLGEQIAAGAHGKPAAKPDALPASSAPRVPPARSRANRKEQGDGQR